MGSAHSPFHAFSLSETVTLSPVPGLLVRGSRDTLPILGPSTPQANDTFFFPAGARNFLNWSKPREPQWQRQLSLFVQSTGAGFRHVFL